MRPANRGNVVLRAAARMTSLFAACRDLAHAPSQQAVFDALQDGLPRTLKVLEKRLNEALADPWPRRLRRYAWQVAIDWHLIPYYGQRAMASLDRAPRNSRLDCSRCRRRTP